MIQHILPRFGRRSLIAALFSSFWLVAAGLLVSNVAHAQQGFDVEYERHISLGDGSINRLKLQPGRTITITTGQDFDDLVVGNAKIADVVPRSSSSFYIQAREHGITTVSIYGGGPAKQKNSKLLGTIDILVERDYGNLRAALKSVAPYARVRADNINNRVQLTGVVNNSVELTRVLEVAQQYSDKPVINALKVKAPQQVALEVRVLEASRNAGRELGVNWRVEANPLLMGLGSRLRVNAVDPTSGVTPGYLNTQTYLQDDHNTISNNVPFGTMVANVLEHAGIRVDTIINALEQKRLARRLAQPNLTTVSGESAKFHVGGEVPIETAVSNGGGVATSITYRPFGVRLEFVPTVLDDGRVNLRVMTEVSDIDSTITVNGNPGFRSRRAEAVIELRNGQSFSMAGLLESVNRRDVEQLPWLGQVEILGSLFRSTAFQKRETDLVIIVTPRLVRPASPLENLQTPLDKTKPSNDWELFALGLMEVDAKMARKFRDGEGIVGPYGHIIDIEFGETHVVSK